MILLKINDHDYTPYIVSPSWQVNAEEMTQMWTDGNLVSHKDVIRTRVKGSFNFANRGATSRDFAAFIQDLDEVKTTRNAYMLEVYCNNLQTYKTIEAFVTYEPAMVRNGGGPVYIEAFTVNIEER